MSTTSIQSLIEKNRISIHLHDIPSQQLQSSIPNLVLTYSFLLKELQTKEELYYILSAISGFESSLTISSVPGNFGSFLSKRLSEVNGVEWWNRYKNQVKIEVKGKDSLTSKGRGNTDTVIFIYMKFK